jgi:hypothetical protein
MGLVAVVVHGVEQVEKQAITFQILVAVMVVPVVDPQDQME